MAEEEQRKIRVTMAQSDQQPAYSNHVNVNHGPHDFRISFALTAMPIGGLPEGVNEIEATVVADVIVPASEMSSIIEVLSRNYATWVKTYETEDES